MTHRQGAARDRAIAARWCALAEQRLQHLTELFESGRWRRYHSELSFLENIREARQAVETWRQLSGDVGAQKSSVIDLPLAGRPLAPAGDAGRQSALHELQRKLLQFAAEPPVTAPLRKTGAEAARTPVRLAIPPLSTSPPETPTTPLQQAAAAPAAAGPRPVADFAFDLERIKQRYPLLRNAL